MNTAHPLSAFRPILPSYDVVIPCYNRAHVVADAVHSVLQQDHPPARVIVVDDGSTDRSAAVIAGLAERYSQVSAVLLPRNGGASHARNAGTASTREPWLAFLDSDDVWLPGAARVLLSACIDSEVDVVVGHFARVESAQPPGAPECGWGGGDIRRALATGGVIGPSWSMVRRDTVLRIGGFDPSFHNCNDWDFYVRAGAAGARFARVDEAVALYRAVGGPRLVEDTAIGEDNALRVMSHPYCSELSSDRNNLIEV